VTNVFKAWNKISHSLIKNFKAPVFQVLNCFTTFLNHEITKFTKPVLYNSYVIKPFTSVKCLFTFSINFTNSVCHSASKFKKQQLTMLDYNTII
jgi:hypothetical protein